MSFMLKQNGDLEIIKLRTERVGHDKCLP